MDVRAWLNALGLEQYVPAFEENDIDPALVRDLDADDLREIGVRSLGHRKRLLSAIAELDPARPGVTRSFGHPNDTGQALTRAGGDDTPSGVNFELVEALRARGYVLTGRLGRGGMGEVYLAHQESVDRDVAVKVLRHRGVSDAKDVTRFEREARAIAALDHPHCVRLYDYLLQGDGNAAIVMEYVRGESLYDRLSRERRLPLERIAAVLVQVCDALAEAHAKGIVHRDLKPANILLQEVRGYREFAKVLDFGLARWASIDESRLTRTGTVSGTPRYLSPEQVLGSETGPRSDLYSLGVVLFEALSGSPPFSGDLEASLLFQHVKATAPALPSSVERPPQIDRLLERLLAKSPTARPRSAAVLRRELAPFASRHVASVRSVSESPGAATERRQVVVLHVVFPLEHGSRSDDEAHAALRERAARVGQVTRRHGGFVLAQSPRELEVVFGAPVARRDDERRAVAAALALRSALAPEFEGATPPSFGLAQGLARAGTLGVSSDSGYLVTGAPLDHAARLAQRAEAAAIWVERELAQRTTDAFEYAESDDAWALVGSRDSPSADGAVPFVGRELEMKQLASLLSDTVREGRGRVAVIAGEAGIGKSRLVDRLRARARTLGWRCARGSLFDVEVPREEEALYRIVDELLDLPEDVTSRVSALERRLGSEALRAEQWPFLYHFLGVALPGALQRLYDAMEEPARREAYRDMLASLVAYECRSEPLLIVVEDVHWAQAGTLDAIETFCQVAADSPLLVVLTSRVEGEEDWAHVLQGQDVHRVDLAPLEEEAALELATHLGLERTDRQAAVVARAAGHPLLLTELARAQDEVASGLPLSVQALVHARLDRLPDDDRAAIQAAAVIGPRVRVEMLRGLVDDAEYAPDRLVDYRLLARESDGFAFAHAMVRDAVYESLIDEQRRALHLRCAALSTDLAVRAGHLDRAASPDAPKAYLEAARHLLLAHHTAAAQRLLARGLELARDLDARIPLLEEKGATELVVGDASASIETHRAIAAVARDDFERYRAEVGAAAAMRVVGRYDDALAALDRAEVAANRSGIAAAQLHTLRGSVYFSQARLEECQASHERALPIARRAGQVLLEAHALSGLGDANYAAARLTTAARMWEECVALARSESLLKVEAVNVPMLMIASVSKAAPSARSSSHPRRSIWRGACRIAAPRRWRGEPPASRHVWRETTSWRSSKAGARWRSHGRSAPSSSRRRAGTTWRKR